MIEKTLNKIISNREVSETELAESFDEIFSGLAEVEIASSFITALKMENKDVLKTAILSAKESISKIEIDFNNENLLENVFLSNNKNFFDLSFLMDIICSANGLGVVKYSFNSFLINRSFSTLKTLVREFNNKNDAFLANFSNLNFAYFLFDSNEKFYKYSFNLLRKLPFFNILSALSNLLNPLNAKNQLIGALNPDEVEQLAKTCLELNNSNSIVMANKNNIPFVAYEAETKIAEAWKSKIFTYSLTPELLGFKERSLDDIKCENEDHNAQIIIDILNNKNKNACYDVLIINAALALYITKKTDSILNGLELAKKTLDSGLALDKFNQIKNFLEKDVF